MCQQLYLGDARGVQHLQHAQQVCSHPGGGRGAAREMVRDRVPTRPREDERLDAERQPTWLGFGLGFGFGFGLGGRFGAGGFRVRTRNRSYVFGLCSVGLGLGLGFGFGVVFGLQLGLGLGLGLGFMRKGSRPCATIWPTRTSDQWREVLYPGMYTRPSAASAPTAPASAAPAPAAAAPAAAAPAAPAAAAPAAAPAAEPAAAAPDAEAEEGAEQGGAEKGTEQADKQADEQGDEHAERGSKRRRTSTPRLQDEVEAPKQSRNEGGRGGRGRGARARCGRGGTKAYVAKPNEEKPEPRPVGRPPNPPKAGNAASIKLVEELQTKVRSGEL